MLLALNLTLLFTAALRVSLWIIVCVYSYRRKRFIATIAFALAAFNSAIVGWLRAGGEVGLPALHAIDLAGTIGAGMIVLAYILADPDERPEWFARRYR